MKAVLAFMGGAALMASSLMARGGSAPSSCLYYVETPTRTDAYFGLEDAQEAMRALGIDPMHTPEGYDITSRKGC